MLYLIISALIVVGDQWFKSWLVLTLDEHAALPLIPGVVRLTHERNTGMAFGLMSESAGARWLLIGVTAAFCLFAAGLLVSERVKGALGRLALASVLGGAVGNLIDRVLNGYVVDMFELEFMRFGIFNIADCFVVVGGLAFCLYVLLSERSGARRGETLPEGDGDDGNHKP